MRTMVCTGAFLNMCIRNSDVIGMAAFSPVVNTRGMIFTHEDGIVLRSTYHVFDLYVNEMEGEYIDTWNTDESIPEINMAATANKEGDRIAIALVNTSKDATKSITFTLSDAAARNYRLLTVNGESHDSYNSIDVNGVSRKESAWEKASGKLTIALEPHSVNVLQIRK